MNDNVNIYFSNSNIPNIITSNQITPRTQNAYDGDLFPIRMFPGEWGPFYQMSEKHFTCKERFQANARYSRAKELKRRLMAKSTNNHDFSLFLIANHEDIEMNAEFKLLEKIKTYFNCEQYSEVEETFRKTSQSRWLGATKPHDYEEANRFYYLEHLRDKSSLYLYEIYFNVPVGNDKLCAILFAGKVKGGTSLQFKMNNHAVECISKCELVEWENSIKNK